jgi:hypothetical protein
MNKEEKNFLTNIIKDTISGEEHLGNELKERCINYIEILQQKIDTYENPKDLTLMYMYCDEKAKDKIKELQNRIDKAIEYLHETSEIGFGELSIYGDSINPSKLEKILKGDDDE